MEASKVRANEFQIKQLKFLESIDMRLKELVEKTSVGPTLARAGENSFAEDADLIQVSGMEAPWVLKMLQWDGKSEVYDEEELKGFLGFNPNDDDPDGLSWCAGFLKRILEECGIDTQGLDLSAMSFANFGSDCEEVNGAILVFQPKQGSRYHVSHVGVKVDDDKLFGGNQGDSVKRSNLAWYKQNAELVACRCPKGYELV